MSLATLSGPRLEPETGTARQLVVLLHGIGADGADLIDLGAHWRDLLPDALFVAPNAPEPAAGAPYGFQWFALGPDRQESRMAGLPVVRTVVIDYLQSLWLETGLSAKDTLLVGFSQGAMTALHVGLSLEEPLMGIIAFSGALVPPEGFAQVRWPKVPVCLVHGDADAVVSVDYTRQAAQLLKDEGYEVSMHISPGVGHGIDPDGMAFASAFIAAASATL